ncbi:MAG TPA: hypothetical protein VEF03_01965 [Candidatus Binataceae bacterium]|nr:hypothetical protein [Candidatus Binataceae bacterium]
MKPKRSLGFAIAVSAGLAMALLPGLFAKAAENSPNREELIRKLQAQEQKYEQDEKYWSQEPITQQDYEVQEAKLKQVIAELKSGQSVSKQEIEAATRRVKTPY